MPTQAKFFLLQRKTSQELEETKKITGKLAKVLEILVTPLLQKRPLSFWLNKAHPIIPDPTLYKHTNRGNIKRHTLLPHTHTPHTGTLSGMGGG